MFVEKTLRSLWPRGDSKIPGLVVGITNSQAAVYAKYGTTSDLVIAHMMAQFSHECGAGTEMVENINYTAERACQVWPSRFGSPADVYKTVKSFPGDPEFHIKLMDSVYGNRMGNRPDTHDGSAFIGRGLSQVTGREGYEKLGTKTGLDLINNPNLVSSPENALECGVADFILCGCLSFAEQDDIEGVTRHLNGGLIGFSERKAWLAKWKRVLATPQQGPVVATKEPPPHVEHGAAVASATVTVVAAAKVSQDTSTSSMDIAAIIVGGAIVSAAIWYAIRQARTKPV